MKYKREENVITYFNEDGKKIDRKYFSTLNAAKRESHKLQMSSDNALGRGSLVKI